MEATFTLVKKTDFEILLENGSKNEIVKMIAIKEKALANAMENVEFYSSIGNQEFADNENARVQKLTRDINKLRAAI